jgi:general secretion pathway protein M
MNDRNKVASDLFAVAILATCLTLLGLIATAPFVRLSWLQQAIAQNQNGLLKLSKQIEQEGELRKELSKMTAPDQDANLLLDGETTGIAGANLQKLVNGLIVEYGGTASSFQILPAEADGNLMRIPMSLSISVGIDALRDILYRLETETPLIFIDGIILRPETESARDTVPYFLGPLAVTLQISGFLKKEAS